MDIRHRLFLVKNRIVKKIGEHDVTFQAVSAPMLLSLLTIAKPVARAVTVLLSDRSQDIGRKITDYKERPQRIDIAEGEDPEALAPATLESTVTDIQAIDPKMAAYRDERSIKAIEDIIAALESKLTQRTLAKLLMSSMPSENFPHDPTDSDLDEFMSGIPLDTLTEMIQAVAEVNAGVLRPMVDRHFPRLKLMAKGSPVENNAPQSESGSQTPSETPLTGG